MALAIQQAKGQGRTEYKAEQMVEKVVAFLRERMGGRGRVGVREAYEEGKRGGLKGVGGPYRPSFDQLLTRAAKRMELRRGVDRSGNHWWARGELPDDLGPVG